MNHVRQGDAHLQAGNPALSVDATKSDQRASVVTTLKSGVIGGGVITVLAAGITLLMNIVLARVLGTTQYGIYVYATTIAAMLTLLARFGLDMSLIRFIPGYSVHQQWGLLRGLMRFVQGITVIAGIGLCVVMIAVGVLQTGMEQDLRTTVIIAACIIPIAAIGFVYQHANRAFKHVSLALLPLNVLAPLLLTITVAVAGSLWGPTILAQEAALAHLITLLISVFLVAVIYRFLVPVQAKLANPQYRTNEWMGVAFTMFLVTSMYQIASQTDTVMLGNMLGTESAGIYNAANRVSMLAIFPLFVSNIIGASLISELYASGRMADLQHMLKQVMRMILFASLLIGLFLLIFGERILGLFGNLYQDAYTIMLLLVGGQFINTLSGASANLLMFTGLHRSAATIMISSTLVNVLLNLALIPQYGLLGASWATIISVALWNVSMVIYARRKLGIDPSVACLFKSP